MFDSSSLILLVAAAGCFCFSAFLLLCISIYFFHFHINYCIIFFFLSNFFDSLLIFDVAVCTAIAVLPLRRCAHAFNYLGNIVTKTHLTETRIFIFHEWPFCMNTNCVRVCRDIWVDSHTHTIFDWCWTFFVSQFEPNSFVILFFIFFHSFPVWFSIFRCRKNGVKNDTKQTHTYGMAAYGIR